MAQHGAAHYLPIEAIEGILAMSTTTTKPVCAGIINIETGEITDTTTQCGTIRLDLKARDELNANLERRIYMVFRLDDASGGVPFVLRHMRQDAPELQAQLLTLQARYRVFQAESNLAAAKAEHAKTSEILAECLALYPDHPDKREIVADALNEVLRELETDIESLGGALYQKTRRLAKLEKESQQHEQANVN